MTCGNCGNIKVVVVETRCDENNLVMRRRLCVACRHQWKTYEIETTLEELQINYDKGYAQAMQDMQDKLFGLLFAGDKTNENS